MEIVPSVKTYDWGKLGRQSAVAQLASLNTANFTVDGNTAYSELWMGSHPSGPSFLKTTGSELKSVLPENLPYLFKVLSIRKALSIQVHPNKSEAIRLHNERPDIYLDTNHKPELAIALTPFLALCGFRPYDEVHQFCQELPPLMKLLGGEDQVAALKNGSTEVMRNCYKKLMTAKPSDTAKCIKQITEKHFDVLLQYGMRDIYDKINQDFPEDVGVLSLFFLNLMRLNPGQAIFLPANEIHAYLSGDCIECMACSDNVIRAGLTPKYKDVQTLISLLKYEGLPPRSKIFHPERRDSYVRVYVPPVDDFAVAQINLSSCTQQYFFEMQPYGSIMIVLQGERKLRTRVNYDLLLKRGTIVYIPAEAAPKIEFFSDTGVNMEEEFVAYIASYNYFKPPTKPFGC